MSLQVTHGTESGYRRHIARGTVSCTGCLAAHAEASARWRARAERGEPPEHGTLYGYRVCGCRCDRCKEANTTYQRAYRAARKASKEAL